MLTIQRLEKIMGITTTHAAERLADLTPREDEIIQLLAAGVRPRKVAEDLGISPKTLDIHRANIKRKLGVKSDVQMVKFVLISQLAAAIAGRRIR